MHLEEHHRVPGGLPGEGGPGGLGGGRPREALSVKAVPRDRGGSEGCGAGRPRKVPTVDAFPPGLTIDVALRGEGAVCNVSIT